MTPKPQRGPKKGRPFAPDGTKYVRKNLSLPPAVMTRARDEAARREISLSALVALAIKNELIRSLEEELGSSGNTETTTKEGLSLVEPAVRRKKAKGA